MYNDYNMMNPGGPGGVSISGKWINKRTGKTITVRDNIIGENGMEIRCSDGSLVSMQEFSRDYIQASDELYDSSGNVIGTAETNPNELMYDLNPVQTQKDNVNDPQIIYEETITNNKVASGNNNLIEKIFSKTNSIPQIDLKINWANFPQQELNTLINFLDVEPQEISEYIYNTYIDKEAVKEKVSAFLLDKIIK